MLGFKKTISIELNEPDLEHILANYKNDDFQLEQIDDNHFGLYASESVGTMTMNDAHAESIKLTCTINRLWDRIEFHFQAPGSSQLFLIVTGMLAIVPFILFKDFSAALLLFVLAFIVFFWFRWVYHHQQKTMIKYFLADIKKYQHFKIKGYYYFSKID